MTNNDIPASLMLAFWWMVLILCLGASVACIGASWWPLRLVTVLWWIACLGIGGEISQTYRRLRDDRGQ